VLRRVTDGTIDRRRLLAGGGAAAGLVLLGGAAGPAGRIDLRLPGGHGLRQTTRAFPQKGEMILQRTRPPLLETPFEVFDQGVFTPNDRFFVRWHWSDFPTEIDPAAFRLTVRGAVTRPLRLSLAELMSLPRIEYAAVNQCAGNSRGLFEPRVPGAQWRHGAMGNARWTGVRLRDVLDRAGVRAGARAVRFAGLDKPLVEGAPQFLKSLSLDHARDGEVMLAFLQNGEQLPLLNGFPLRLVVPGWYSTYWVKMVHDIEVLAGPDDNFWMAKAYKIPANPTATTRPGAHPETVPISAMVPRAFLTNVGDARVVPAGRPLALRGLALGGDHGVAKVELSTDGGRSWAAAALGRDEGRYSFRRFEARLPAPARGPLAILARCTNTAGRTQPLAPNWNGSGYQRGVVERVEVTVA
jgi:DMSO/TMAO reductase YedYZ molybdopterin-dependent catalytic subunit